MSLTAEENLALRRACQEITYKPRAPHQQWFVKDDNGSVWCEDWEMIEVLKYMFLGAEAYFNELPPRRLRKNSLFSKESIKDRAEKLIHSSNRDFNAIIELIRSIRNDTAPRIA